MPIVPSVSSSYTPSTYATATPESHEEITNEIEAARPGWFGGIIGSALLSPVDFVDTTLSSVTLGGVDRGSINKKFLSMIGVPSIDRFAEEQQGTTELISGLAGIYVANSIAARAFAPGSMVMRGMRQMPGIKRISALDSQYDIAFRAAQQGMREAATRGEMGSAAFKGVMNYRALGVQTRLDLGKARAGVVNLGRARVAREAAATELVMAGTMNTNSIFFSDDLNDNIANAAIGIGVGGLIGGIQAGWALRRAANSKAMEAERLLAYDRKGFEISRQTVGSVDDVLGKFYLGYDHELESNFVTSQLLQASDLRLPLADTERGRSLFSNRESFANQVQAQAYANMNKITTGGLNHISSTSFNDSHAAFAALREGATREPTLLYGASEIGIPNGWEKGPDGLGIWGTDKARGVAIESRLDAIQKIFKNGGIEKVDPQTKKTIIEPLSSEQLGSLRNEVRKLIYDNSKVGVVQLLPGELAPIEFGKVVDGFVERKVRPQTKAGKTIWESEIQNPDVDKIVAVGDDLTIYTHANTPVSHISMHDNIQFWRAARKATDRLAEGPNVVVLPKKPTWAQLDMAERIIQKSGNPAKITFPVGLDRQTAIVESFAQKVDAINNIMAGKNQKRFGRAKPLKLNDVDAFALRVRFNLPMLSPHESAILHTAETPVEQVLRSFKSGDEVRKIGYQGLQDAIETANQIQGLTDEIGRKFTDLNGRSFDFLLDSSGNPLPPVMMYKRPMMPDDWNRRALDESITTRKAFQRALLIGPGADPLIREIATTILSSPDFIQALKVSELADNQHQSWLPGMVNQAPQSFLGALTEALNVGGREFRDRDIQTMLSASRIKDLQDRLTREIMSRVINETMGDVMTRVAAPRNGESRVMLNHFFAQRPGWDIVETPVETALPSGKKAFGFELADTAKNHERFELQYGRPMEKGDMLQNAQGVKIVVDELGFEALSRFNQLSETRRSMQNTLLRSQGLSEIQRQPWWVPSESMEGKLVAYTFDADGKLVPGGRVSASTEEGLNEAKEALAKSNWFQPGWTIRSRDRVTAFMDLWDKAQMDWHDAASTVIASGKTNRGGLATQAIDLRAWDRANASMVDGFIEQGSDLMTLLTKDSLVAARARAEAGRVETRVGKSSQSKYNGIYDRYVQNLSGKNSSQNREGMIAPIFRQIGERIDDFIRDRTPSSAKIFGAAQDKFRYVNPFTKSDTNQKLFDKLVKDLGPYMPFNSVKDFVEAQTGHALPKEIKEISAKISWMESTSKLRWFESVHAMMNFGSLIHNLPAIGKGIQRMEGETPEQWAQRIGHVASIFGEQHQVAVVNPAKLLFSAFNDARKSTYDEFTQKAFARGFMDQEVAELERQFSAIKTPGDVRAFFFGDPKAELDPNAKGLAKMSQYIKKKGGLDYYFGYMSDKSEDYSRRVGMYFGRRLAQLHGIESVDDQLAFAHDIANKAIANYDPRNRPEIFQGWLGAPIGLFQSYVTNYYSRMFRLFETANYRTLASQALWQTSVFGIKSFGPFWDQANQMFFDRGGVLTEEATASFERRLGTTEGDLLMYGVLSNLPKMFGGEGASVYTRGDINVRLPVVNMPVASSVARIWQGINQGLDAVINNTEGLTGQQAAEILSNTLGNRPLAGLIEMTGAGGYDTAKTGETISQSLRDRDDNSTILNTAYRLMGIRSMAQQKEIDSFYADKTAGEEQAARQTTLRLETRANIRAGNFDALPNLFVKYVENGGDLKYFTRWYNDAMESALETRSERRLNDLMKNDKKMASVNRLLDAGVRPKDEDDADDYGAAQERRAAVRAKVDELLSVTTPSYGDDDEDEE